MVDEEILVSVFLTYHNEATPLLPRHIETHTFVELEIHLTSTVAWLHKLRVLVKHNSNVQILSILRNIRKLQLIYLPLVIYLPGQPVYCQLRNCYHSTSHSLQSRCHSVLHF